MVVVGVCGVVLRFGDGLNVWFCVNDEWLVIV